MRRTPSHGTKLHSEVKRREGNRRVIYSWQSPTELVPFFNHSVFCKIPFKLYLLTYCEVAVLIPPECFNARMLQVEVTLPKSPGEQSHIFRCIDEQPARDQKSI